MSGDKELRRIEPSEPLGDHVSDSLKFALEDGGDYRSGLWAIADEYDIKAKRWREQAVIVVAQILLNYRDPPGSRFWGSERTQHQAELIVDALFPWELKK
jgi:hypothetical protein